MDNKTLYETSFSAESFAPESPRRAPRASNPMRTLVFLMLFFFVLAVFALIIAPAFL
jgi:hypothetical protein